jgi:hypothetical protein
VTSVRRLTCGLILFAVLLHTCSIICVPMRVLWTRLWSTMVNDPSQCAAVTAPHVGASVAGVDELLADCMTACLMHSLLTSDLPRPRCSRGSKGEQYEDPEGGTKGEQQIDTLWGVCRDRCAGMQPRPRRITWERLVLVLSMLVLSVEE